MAPDASDEGAFELDEPLKPDDEVESEPEARLKPGDESDAAPDSALAEVGSQSGDDEYDTTPDPALAGAANESGDDDDDEYDTTPDPALAGAANESGDDDDDVYDTTPDPALARTGSESGEDDDEYDTTPDLALAEAGGELDDDEPDGADDAHEPLAEPESANGASQPEAADDGRHWFVIHCYSGYENKVRHNLEQRIESMGMRGKIFDVVVPTEEEIEVKDGKRRTVERRVFPGYLLVQMVMSEDSWYVVRNTPGVTGFVGMGNTPTPLRPEEVAQILRRMEAEAPKVKVTFKPGQKVRIVDGPFNDFIGTVAEIDMDRTKVRVMVSFFGRETPVELDFLQVEKV